jgi:hypothetical protein
LSHFSFLCVINIYYQLNNYILKFKAHISFYINTFLGKLHSFGMKKFAIVHYSLLDKLSIVFLVSCLALMSFTCSDSNALSNKELIADSIVIKSINFTQNNKLDNKNDINANGYIFEVNDKKVKLGFYFLKPNLMRLKTEFSHLIYNIVANNNEGWSKLGIMPTLPLDDETKNRISIVSSAFFPEIFTYNRRNDSIFYGGTSKVNGLESYKVILINKNGLQVEYYFSTIDFRIVKLSKIIEIMNEPVKVEIYYEDYIEFNGIKFPTLVESYSGDKELKFKIETINYDSGLTENDFARPN